MPGKVFLFYNLLILPMNKYVLWV